MDRRAGHALDAATAAADDMSDYSQFARDLIRKISEAFGLPARLLSSGPRPYWTCPDCLSLMPISEKDDHLKHHPNWEKTE